MKQTRAQDILVIFEIIKDIDSDIELIKYEKGIAHLKLDQGKYSQDLHIKLQDQIDTKLTGVSLYFY